MRRRTTAVAALLTVSVGGYAAWSVAADAQPSYRTAGVTRGDVQETLDLTGTIGSVDRSDLGFGVSGTVSKVYVAVGDQVSAGQVIARLDPADLKAAVVRARADLAAARLQLETDQDAQAETVTEAVTTTTSASTDATTPQRTTTPTPSDTDSPTQTPTTSPTTTPDQPSAADQALVKALKELRGQQQAVTAAQTDATSALDTAAAALDTQTQACSTAFTADPEPTEEPTTDPTEAPTEEPTDGPTEEPTDDSTDDSSDADAACTAALATVQDAQETVSDKQDTLQTALNALAGTLTDAVETLSSTGTQQPTQPAQPTESEQPTEQATEQSTEQPTTEGSTSQATPSASGSTGGSTPQGGAGQSTTVTAATLARDQASIDEARAALITATQAATGAVLTAPTAGTVVSLDVADGDAATAGTDVAVVLSGGVTQAVVSATTDQVRELTVGQVATVTPAGGTAQPATVSTIAAAPATDTSGSSSYAVTVTLDETGIDVAEGVTASVAVVLDEADDAVVVPLSAVSSGRVRVVGDDGTAEYVRVTTGLVGATTVEVTDGLEEGDRIVLADLGQDLPTGDDTDTGQRTGPGGGGFGGTGGGPGGGTGGPPSGTGGGGRG